MSNLAASVITWLMNLLMMHFAGEDGVAAVTVVLYTQFFFTAVFLGFSNGVAPVISYNYGSRNKEQLHMVFCICMRSMVFLFPFDDRRGNCAGKASYRPVSA